jgi:hypothetical protein
MLVWIISAARQACAAKDFSRGVTLGERDAMADGYK